MADNSKKLIDELRKASEATARLTKIQEKAATVTGALQEAIEMQTKLSEFNLKATELLGMNLGGVTNTIDGLTGFSKVFDEYMMTSTATTEQFLGATLTMGRTVNDFSENLPKNINEFAELTGHHIDRLGNNLIITSEKFLGGASQQAAATRDLIPVATATAAKFALFEAGLEKNSAGLGRFLVRAELLGQDIGGMSRNVRSLTNSLSLTARQQAFFAQSVEDSAKTYKASSESVLEAMTRAAETISIANFQGNAQTNKLFTQIQAMTDRIAPEALTTALAPLFTQGVESLAVAGRLGVRDQLQRIQQGTGTVEDFQQIAQAFSDFRDQFMTGQSYEGDVIGAQIVSQLSTLTTEQINMLEAANQAIEQSKANNEEVATLNDATVNLSTIMKHMDDAITMLRDKALIFLQELTDKYGADTIAKLGLIAAAVGIVVTVLGVIGAVIGGVMLVLGPIFGAIAAAFSLIVSIVTTIGPILATLTALIGPTLGVLEGIGRFFGFSVFGTLWDGMKSLFMGLLGKIGDFFIWLYNQIPFVSEIEALATGMFAPDAPPNPAEKETADSTRILADEVESRQNEKLLERAATFSSQHASLLDQLIKISNRQDVQDDMMAENAQRERIKLNMLVGNLVTEMTLQNDMLGSSRMNSYFRLMNAGDGS